MTENLSFTPEQFNELLKAVRSGGALPQGVVAAAGAVTGLGAPAPRVLGLGHGDASMGPLSAGVYSMLAAGSPRLALAKALGVPLAPYCINVRATFQDSDDDVIPDVGSDVKIVQDTLIDALVIRITTDRAPVDELTTLSDFFFNFQSGIEATLDVLGAPRYAVAPKFTPLSTLADVVTGGSHWPGGWLLTYQQQLQMSFFARVALPDFPVTVVCTYRGWIPVGEMFVQMTNMDAFDRLAECGVTCDGSYVKRVCSKTSG